MKIVLLFFTLFPTVIFGAKPKTVEVSRTLAVKAIKAETYVCQMEPIEVELRYPALIQPVVQGKMVSEIGGYVTRLKKKLGEPVRKGETIFYLKKNQVGARFNEYAVKSPVTGHISDLKAYVGALIKAGTVVGEVTDLSQLQMIVEVPAEDSLRVKVGNKATFEYAGEKVEALVVGLSPVISTVTGTATMELRPLAKNLNLRVGLIGNATVRLAKVKNITVPPKSIINVGSKKFVRKVGKDNKVEMVEVSLGDLILGKQVITKGLSQSDEVVVKAGDFLRDGDLIERDNKPGKKTENSTKI